MKRNKIHLKESDLYNIISKSVHKILESVNEQNEIKISETYTIKNGEKRCVDIKLENVEENKLEGYFETWVEGYDDETYVEGSIIIIDNEVVDFDGVYDLPKAVKKALTSHGYKIDW